MGMAIWAKLYKPGFAKRTAVGLCTLVFSMQNNNNKGPALDSSHAQ